MVLDRRRFLMLLGIGLAGVFAGSCAQPPQNRNRLEKGRIMHNAPDNGRVIRLFLCGDVMTGRGIDQVLAHPSNPRLHEPYLGSALDYVRLAEAISGPIHRPVDFAYIWGDALTELEHGAPDLRIVNLETAVTTSDAYERKGINYRMHPRNIPALTAASIDCAVLANNHVLDWGREGLIETLKTLEAAGIATAGAGRNRAAAEAPAVLDLGAKGRVLVFAYGHASSGVGAAWAAASDWPGVAVLEDLSPATVRRIAARVRATERAGDLVVVSVHWGGNWGYEVPASQRAFAYALIDVAGVDIVHGHSSHHVKGIEVYNGRPIFYGCGDLLSDYEGIEGYETYRDDLGLMYLVQMDADSGMLRRVDMIPTRLKRLRLSRASPEEATWLAEVLDREGRRLGTQVTLAADNRLTLRW